MSDCGCNNFPASLGNVTFAWSVGIGTTTPGASLEVAGSGALFSGTLATETPTGNVYAGVYGGTPRIIFGGSTSHEIDNSSGALRVFRPGATPDILIDASGNIGLGTTSPGAGLEVAVPGAKFSGTLATENVSDGNVYVGVYEGTPRIIFGGSTTHEMDNSGGALRLFRPGAAPDVLIDQNGQVGLGTSTPHSALDLESPGASITIGSTKVADASGCYYA